MARTKKATAAAPSDDPIRELTKAVNRAEAMIGKALDAIELHDNPIKNGHHPVSGDCSPEDLEELESVARGEGDLSAMTARVLKMPAQKPGKSKQDYATPMELIRAVEKRFGVLVHDLAAHARNARVKSYFSIEEGVDSLKQEWATLFPEGNLWLNPPFADIAPWAAKCLLESRKREGLIIMLTPASIGSEWFAESCEKKALIVPLRPRISFDGKNPYPKDCMLSVFGLDPNSETVRMSKRFGTKHSEAEYLSGFESWRWDKEAA